MSMLSFEQAQSQVASPRLQRSVRLLQMSSMEYSQELSEAVRLNPFLEEREEQEEEPGAVEPMPAQPFDTIARDEEQSAPVEPVAAREAEDPPDLADWPDRIRPEGDSDVSAIDFLDSHVGLDETLRTQANVLRIDARERTLIHALIDCLEEDGYLRMSLEEVAACADVYPAATTAEIRTALSLLQSFDPAGVGARDLKECLLLQWRQSRVQMSAADRQLGACILAEHLPMLATRDLQALARKCQVPVDDIARVSALIRHLNPHPGRDLARDETRYIVPDLVARKVQGRWIAQLNPAVVPRLRINEQYVELFRRHRDNSHRQLAGHLQEARWLLRNIDRRYATILQIARAILERQHRFLDLGVFAMKPLALQDVATECGLHSSTVCRATNNKYMSTPVGMFELKYFFARTIPMGEGVTASVAIHGMIRELLAAESPTAPLSDPDIVKQLKRQGLHIARRTVTKYRHALRIPPATGRRHGAQAGA